MTTHPRLLFLAFGVLVAIRISLALNTQYIATDSQIHQMMAEALHRGLPLDLVPLSHAIPLALAMPWAIMQSIYTNSLDYIIHLGNIISSVGYCSAVLALFFLARRFLSARGALAACTIFLMHDRAWAFSGIGEPYAVYTFVLTLFFLALYIYLDCPSWRNTIFLSIMLAVCTYSRKEGVIAFGVLLVSVPLMLRNKGVGFSLRLAARPALIGIALAATIALIVYSATGVVLNKLVIDIILFKGSASMSYMLERESVTALGDHSLYYKAANMLQYLWLFIYNNISSWRLWSIFLAAGVIRTAGDFRFLPFYAYILIHTLSGLFSQYQVESDQLKSVTDHFIQYDAIRYQMPWLPIQAIVITYGVAWLLTFSGRLIHHGLRCRRLFIHRRLLATLSFLLVLIIASSFSIYHLISVQHRIITRGNYDNTTDPIRDFASVNTAQVPMLMVTSELRRRDVVGSRIAVISRHTTSANLISLGNFGGPNRYLTCSSGDWQWIDGISEFIPGGHVMESTIFINNDFLNPMTSVYSCHDLVNSSSLDALDVNYLLIDIPFATVFPHIQELIEECEPIAVADEAALYKRVIDQPTHGAADSISAPVADSEPLMMTKGFGINSPSTFENNTLVVSGRSIIFVDDSGLAKWRFPFEDLLYPAQSQSNLLVTFGSGGQYVGAFIDKERSLVFSPVQPFAQPTASALSQRIHFAGYADGSLVSRHPSDGVILGKFEANEAIAAVRIFDDDILWFLTSTGRSALASALTGQIISESDWAHSPGLGPHIYFKGNMIFCDKSELITLSIPDGRELSSLRLDARCYDFAGEQISNHFFVSTSEGIFLSNGNSVKNIGKHTDSMKISCGGIDGRLAGAGLKGLFVEWDKDGMPVQEKLLGDSVIAKPSFSNGIWHVLTERGHYHRINSALD